MNKLYETRKSLNITQSQAAKLLRVHKNTIGVLERSNCADLSSKVDLLIYRYQQLTATEKISIADHAEKYRAQINKGIC